METIELEEYLEANPPRGFEPKPYYEPDSDVLFFFFKEDEAYARRVDDTFTVYLSFKNEEPVGFELKGLKHMMKAAAALGKRQGKLRFVLEHAAFKSAANRSENIGYMTAINRGVDETITPEADNLLELSLT